MIRNHLKTAFRNVLKYKTTSFINILGLAVGLACFIFIFLWVQDEMTYDRFYKNGENIYRVNHESKFQGEEHFNATCPGMLSEVISQEIPEVKAVARVFQWGNYLVMRDLDPFNCSAAFSTPEFFDVFKYRVIKGDVSNMDAANKLVLTEDVAKRIFGNEEPLGKMLKFPEESRDPFEVVAIMENVDKKTFFPFEILVSEKTHDWMHLQNSWFDNLPFIYVRLNEGITPETVESKFPQLIKKYLEPILLQFSGDNLEQFYNNGNKYNFHLQPITDIHLYSHLERELKPGGNILYLRLFSIVAIFILLIACVNFTNISTIQSANNSKEVGVNKVFGALKPQLFSQYMIKSFLLTFLSIVVAVFIVELLMPQFNNLCGKELPGMIIKNPLLLLSLFIVLIFVSSISGSYPAFRMASLNPVQVLKGKVIEGKKGINFRNILVIFQFTLTIIIIICTMIIFKQLRFFEKYNLGFDKEYVIVVERGKAINLDKRESFKQELLRNNSFSSASFCQDIPSDSHFNFYLQLEGSDEMNLHDVSFIRADYDYAKTLSLQTKEGRFFSNDFGTDSMAVVINEAAIKEFGIVGEAVGKRFFLGTDSNNVSFYWNIIGVIKDYNFRSLKLPVTPVVIVPQVPAWAYFLLVKVKPGNPRQTIAELQAIWDKFANGQPFAYSFLDERLNDLYESEILTKRLFTIFSILSIIIACLGLFSLALYITLQKTKEIGIRKVNGASTLEVMILIIKGFSIWVGISYFIALPVSYYIMNNWLQNYAYRTNLSWWIFVVAAIISFAITIFTVGWQCWKVARKNPVEALRYE